MLKWPATTFWGELGMALVKEAVTLDGSTEFTVFGNTLTWGEFQAFGVFPGGPPDTYQLDMTLAGGGWGFAALGFDSGSAFTVNITDTNDGVRRGIGILDLGANVNVNITLFNSRFRQIENDGGNSNITLGTQTTRQILLSQGNDTITQGAGAILHVSLGDGVNVFNGGDGWLGSLESDENSTFTFNGGNGNFGSIRAFGNNTMTFENGGDSIVMGHGDNNLTLNAGFFGAITAFGEDFSTSNITIGGAAFVRSIGVSGGKDAVTVSGGIEQAQLGSNDDTFIALAGAQVDVVNLSGGNNLFRSSGDHVWVVNAFSGNDRFEFLAGQTDQAYAGGGNNTVLLDGGASVGTLRMNEGNDTVTVRGGAHIGSLMLGEGANRLTLVNGQIDSVLANGDETISLQGNSRILSLKMDEGVNSVTSQDGFIESILAWGAKNTIQLGAGGVGQILLTGSAAAQVIKSAGWIGSLQIYAGDQTNVQSTTVVTGAEGAGYIQTSKGNDIITTGKGQVLNIYTFDGNDKVTVGSGEAKNVFTGIGNDTVNASAGRMDVLYTEEGNDLVTLGAKGARFVALGDGDDTLVMTRFVPEWGIQIQGDAGSDTVDLSAFATALHVTLNEWGSFQNIGSPSGGGAPTFGYVALTDIDNLIGSAFGDWMEGSGGANTLTSGAGADSLFGLDGADRLIGGMGNDTLNGGNGGDTFVFKPGEGTDRIEDFTLTQDKIELRAANGLGDLTFTKVGTDVRIDFGAGLHILVLDHTVAEMKNAANFLF